MSEYFQPLGRGSSNYAQCKASVTVSPSGIAIVRAHVKHPSEGWNEHQLIIAKRFHGVPLPTTKDEAVGALWDCLGMWLWDSRTPPVVGLDTEF